MEKNMPLFRHISIEEVPSIMYLHSMPGRDEDIDYTFEQLKANKIHSIVALAEKDEIQIKSPDYYEAIESNTVPVEKIIRVPIPDFGVPETEKEINTFKAAIDESYKTLMQRKNILIHCAAGIGRTGTFAAALLLRFGIAIDEAIEKVESKGSTAETPDQLEFLLELSKDYCED